MHVSKYVVYQDLDKDHALIASSLTGAVDLLDSNSKAAWLALAASNKADGLDKKFIARLRKRGYLYHSADEEAHLFNELAAAFQSSQLNYPLRFAICPTYQCNLACKYCYEGRLPQVSTVTLREPDVEALYKSIDCISGSRGGQKAQRNSPGVSPFCQETRLLLSRFLLKRRNEGTASGLFLTASAWPLTSPSFSCATRNPFPSSR